MNISRTVKLQIDREINYLSISHGDFDQITNIKKVI